MVGISPVISWAGELEDAKERVRLNPNDAVAHNYLGAVYGASGQHQDAIASFKEAIRINPDSANAHHNLGYTYNELGQHQDAIASFKEAIRIKPDDTDTYLNLGHIYLGQGKINTALTILEKADQIAPNNLHTLASLGMVYWELDKPQEALKVLGQALDSNPESPEDLGWVFSNLAEVYERLGKYDDAIEASKKALEIDYDDPLANFILGLSYDAKGDGLNAISHMVVAKKQFQESKKNYAGVSKWDKRNKRKYLANSSMKLRTFYEKYKFNPEDFGEPPIKNIPIAPPQTAQVKEKNPPEEQTPRSGIGSGFFVSKMGHVITNAHVVQNCKKITIGDNANKQVPAELINTDRSNDLALLKLSTLEMASTESKSLIQKLGIVVVPLASKGLLRSEDVRLGEKVLVAGYPFGELFSNTIKVTSGIVSATRGAGDDSGQFQLDAAVQPGNSGGPIYDSGGNIVGVINSQLDKLKVAKAIGSLPENVNFGIKASTVRQFLISSGLPSKKAERSEEKSTEQLAEIAQNQALMVMCLQ